MVLLGIQHEGGTNETSNELLRVHEMRESVRRGECGFAPNIGDDPDIEMLQDNCSHSGSEGLGDEAWDLLPAAAQEVEDEQRALTGSTHETDVALSDDAGGEGDSPSSGDARHGSPPRSAGAATPVVERPDQRDNAGVTGATEGIRGIVTHYGESYNGRPLGCGNIGGALNTARALGGVGDGLYRSSDPTISASAWRPDGSRAYPCGAVLRVLGPAGEITVVVGDACPGCAWNHLDLSEAGIEAVCGFRGTCSVTISRVE